MTPGELDLARRLVALEGWEWRQGMMGVGERLDGPVRLCQHPIAPWLGESLVPNLHDPATAGVLLAMLRERANAVALNSQDGEECAWELQVWPGKPSFCAEADDLGVAVARALVEVWGG